MIRNKILKRAAIAKKYLSWVNVCTGVSEVNCKETGVFSLVVRGAAILFRFFQMSSKRTANAGGSYSLKKIQECSNAVCFLYKVS